MGGVLTGQGRGAVGPLGPWSALTRNWRGRGPLAGLEGLDSWGRCPDTALERSLSCATATFYLGLNRSLLVHGRVRIPVHVGLRTLGRCAAGVKESQQVEVKKQGRASGAGTYPSCEMARSWMPFSTVAPLSVLACSLETSRASPGVARLDMEPSCGRLSAWALYLSSPGLSPPGPWRPPSRLPLSLRGERLRVRGRLYG